MFRRDNTTVTERGDDRGPRAAVAKLCARRCDLVAGGPITTTCTNARPALPAALGCNRRTLKGNVSSYLLNGKLGAAEIGAVSPHGASACVEGQRCRRVGIAGRS